MWPLKGQACDFQPIYNLFEGHLEVLVVNAQHIKAVGFPQDGHQRCGVDCRVAATRLAQSQLYPLGTTAGLTRAHPLSGSSHRGASQRGE